MAKRVYFLVHGGVVQGVFFRKFTRAKAVELGITGWCRNIPNEKVEGEAQGKDQAIKKFLKAVDDGPKHAHVVKLDKEDRDLVEDETDFEIRRHH
ncbi:acylphosphatase [Zalerion maritima]|uniref:acylphosphatase n=1 Tax=Zalerion maritima TaxID=339359 RepID=A0AAD5WSK1_9PEZI|nr:acylphosphatase [Zalerion maritima]